MPGPVGPRIDSATATNQPMQVSHVGRGMTCMSVPGEQAGASQAETGSVVNERETREKLAQDETELVGSAVSRL